MLGELYANALGVKRDYGKAIEWYKRAADLGDREAMFALAMLRICGRGGPRRPREARQTVGFLRQARPAQGRLQSGAALYGRANACRRISSAPPNCCASPPTPAIRKRNMRWRPSTRRATALQRHRQGSAAVAGGLARRQCRCRSRVRDRAVQRHRHAEERGRRGSAAAQSRQTKQPDRSKPSRPGSRHGQGAPTDKIEGLKWHIVAKTAGKGDLMLDEAMAQATPEERAKAESARLANGLRIQ